MRFVKWFGPTDLQVLEPPLKSIFYCRQWPRSASGVIDRGGDQCEAVVDFSETVGEQPDFV